MSYTRFWNLVPILSWFWGLYSFGFSTIWMVSIWVWFWHSLLKYPEGKGKKEKRGLLIYNCINSKDVSHDLLPHSSLLQPYLPCHMFLVSHKVKSMCMLYLWVSRLASQNTLERRRDESRRRIYATKIPHVCALSLK